MSGGRGVFYGGTLAVKVGTGAWITSTNVVDGYENETSIEESDLTCLGDSEKVIRCVSDKDPGEFKFDVAEDIEEAFNAAVHTSHDDKSFLYYKVNHPKWAAPVIFGASVKSISAAHKKRDLMVETVTLRRSGLMTGEALPDA